jgi:hypothetical protein
MKKKLPSWTQKGTSWGSFFLGVNRTHKLVQKQALTDQHKIRRAPIFPQVGRDLRASLRSLARASDSSCSRAAEQLFFRRVLVTNYGHETSWPPLALRGSPGGLPPPFGPTLVGSLRSLARASDSSCSRAAEQLVFRRVVITNYGHETS